jgi:hypothetical protein
MPSRNTRAITMGLAGAVAVAGLVSFVLSGGASEPAVRATAAAPPILVAPVDIFDPVAAGEVPPVGFRQLLWRDRIDPDYNPEFAAGETVDWPDDSLVIGVAGVNVAKAYPVTYLNQREMVDDDIEGEPILVSW